MKGLVCQTLVDGLLEIRFAIPRAGDRWRIYKSKRAYEVRKAEDQNCLSVLATW